MIRYQRGSVRSATRTWAISRALFHCGWIACLLAACTLTATPAPTPALTTQPTLTATASQPTSTPEPTPAFETDPKDPEAPLDPLGTSNNPIVIGFVSITQDPAVEQNAAAFAQSIAEQSSLVVQSRVFPDYDTLLKSLEEQTVHVSWLPPFTYLIAQKAGTADVGLMTSHFGVYSYGFQVVAHRDDAFNVYFDPQTNQSTTDANIALIQFHEKRPCWVDPLSPSGYVVPRGYFNTNGIVLQEGVVTQSHSAVIRAIYAQGICDFGITYATYGDPRTASSILESLPDVLDKVVILWQSEAVIPNTNVSFMPSMPIDKREKVTQAIIDYAKNEAGATTLSTLLDYDVEALKRVDDTFYNDLRTYFENSGVTLFTLLGK